MRNKNSSEEFKGLNVPRNEVYGSHTGHIGSGELDELMVIWKKKTLLKELIQYMFNDPEKAVIMPLLRQDVGLFF